MTENRRYKSPAKRAEFTYGLHGASLAELVSDNAATILQDEQMAGLWPALDEMIMGSRRALNDKYELLRQLIAYGLTFKIVRSGDGLPYPLFAVYKRNKLNNEVRLASALSLGAGGHVEQIDAREYLQPFDQDSDLDPNEERAEVLTGEIDCLETLDTSFFREYFEEVQLTSADGLNLLIEGERYEPRRFGLVMDSKPQAGYVGNTHVGVLYATEVDETVDFDMKEELNDAVGWFTPVQLKNHIDGSSPIDEVPFEPWSVLLIERISEIALHLMNAERLTVSEAAFDKITELLAE